VAFSGRVRYGPGGGELRGVYSHEWHDRAACDGRDPSGTIFFPERGQSAARAKAICAGCPVVGECLEWALQNHREAEFGILGGMGERERRAERKRRREAA